MSRPVKIALNVLLAATAGALLASSVVLRPSPLASERCTGERYDLVTAPGGRSPYIRLAANGRSGSFLLDYGTTRSSLSDDAFGSAKRNGTIAVEKFSLPTFPHGDFNLVRYFAPRQPTGGQLGIIGTDFLALLVADFSFRPGGGNVVLGEHPCDPVSLAHRGMIAVHQTGFFSRNPQHVEMGRPNVPVLFLHIGGVTTWAQVDTGYDDGDEGVAIDINEALYQQLSKAGVMLRPAGRIATTTCSGSETRDVFSAPQAKIAVATETGLEISEIDDAKLILKHANGCGGIAGMAAPAAQLGASIVAGLGSIVFDPKSETIWIPKGAAIR